MNEAELLVRVRNLLLIGNGVDGPRELPRAGPRPSPAERPPEPEPDHDDEAHALRAIIERGGPDIVFQPIVELASGNTVGVEALARFGTDAHPPDHWFAYAATLGLGTELEVAAIAAALRQLDHLDPDVPPRAEPLARDAGRGSTAASVLDGTDPHRLVFELPESGPGRRLRHAARGHGAVARRRACSSASTTPAPMPAGLRHILDLAPDIVKLDIALTRGIDTDAVKRTLAGSLKHLADELGATITAEGIETQAELDALRDLGIVNGQGFHLARPAPFRPEVVTRRRAAGPHCTTRSR